MMWRLACSTPWHCSRAMGYNTPCAWGSSARTSCMDASLDMAGFALLVAYHLQTEVTRREIMQRLQDAVDSTATCWLYHPGSVCVDLESTEAILDLGDFCVKA